MATTKALLFSTALLLCLVIINLERADAKVRKLSPLPIACHQNVLDVSYYRVNDHDLRVLLFVN